ncbi:hypothetical protein NSE01_37070 [Novosphingobium sediminis]|uniref:Uncharacterized protein n=1 Tax=Novosphingobium sediminis TaxID=707214 RepID=A0A512AQ76_9SPHN|nr:hypothetical protein NSE01_37070 [Novosphingobium sediminis]
MEIAHLCARADRGTLFEDMRVLDLRQPHLRDMPLCADQAAKVVCTIVLPKMLRIDGRPDMRYNSSFPDVTKSWPIVKLVQILDRIKLEGDMTAPNHVWVNERFRPAQVTSYGVCFLDWPLIPLYRSGGYNGFCENIDALVDVLDEISAP